MTGKKTFLLGVGCQKGGTTWLYDYLASHPNCDLGFTKEYHVFDALFEKNASKFYTKKLRQAGKQLLKRSRKQPMGNPDADAKLAQQTLYTSFYLDPKNYATYFANLYDASPNTTVVGDITPSYNMLTSQNFRYIRELLEAQGFHVKVVFLMRDPVDRCISAIRMHARDNLSKKPKNERPSMDAIFRKRVYQSGCEKRTRYENTISALDVVFDKDDIHYGFYETLFTNDGLKAITDFLGLSQEPADFGKRVNASPSEENISDEALQQACRFYEETYQFCIGKFGSDRIQALWPYARLLLKEE